MYLSALKKNFRFYLSQTQEKRWVWGYILFLSNIFSTKSRGFCYLAYDPMSYRPMVANIDLCAHEGK